MIKAAICSADQTIAHRKLDLQIIGARWNDFFNLIASHSASLALSVVLLSAIYRLIPYERVNWKDLMPGIIVAAVAIEVGKELFALYVGNLARFNAVYGSVSSIIVLLIWLYFSARLVLYGAEVISVYRKSRPVKPGETRVDGDEEVEE